MILLDQLLQRPVNILVTPSPRDPRLKAGGWFSRSFASASGILIAVALFLIVPPLVVCGGCFIVGSGAIAEAGKQQRELTSQAKKFAMPKLRELGIVELDKDAVASDLLGDTMLMGKGRDSAGTIHDIVVVWKVGEFNKQKTWQLQRVQIDAETVWSKD